MSDQITALRAQVAAQAAEIHALKWGPEHFGNAVGRDLLADATATIAAQAAIIAEARAALEKIACDEVPFVAGGYPTKCPHGWNFKDECRRCLSDFARAALARIDAEPVAPVVTDREMTAENAPRVLLRFANNKPILSDLKDGVEYVRADIVDGLLADEHERTAKRIRSMEPVAPVVTDTD